MVKVFFESNSHAELVATFENESLYISCLPTLEIEAKKQNMIVTESAEEMLYTKFARKCSITGKGMNVGYVINDGEIYIQDHYTIFENYILNKTQYKTIEEAYEDDFYYWTTWEDEGDFQFQMIDEILTEIQ